MSGQMETHCPYCGEIVEVTNKEAFICPSCGSHVGVSGGTTVLMRTGVVQDTMVGAMLGAYRIKRLLGCGGMGKVYLAEHEPTEREVALKVLSDELSEKEHFVERFLQEARAAARLLHPNIVAVFEAGKADDHYFIAMEYVDGKTLSQMIFERGRLQEEEALRIIRQIASAIAYAHRQNVVHRDIKPANILLTRDGVAKIADMGIAKRLDSPGVTMPGTVMGTPYYMAPEQATDSSSVDHRADIYSLGATLYHAVTGTVPFDGATAPEVLAKLQVQSLNFPKGTKISPQVRRLISQMMEKDVKKRLQTAEEVVAEVDAILGGGRVAAQHHSAGFWVAVAVAVVFAFLFFARGWKQTEPKGPDIKGLRERLSKVSAALKDGKIGAKRAIEEAMKVAKEAGSALGEEVARVAGLAMSSLTGEVRALIENFRVDEARKRVRVKVFDYGIEGMVGVERQLWRLREEVERARRLNQTASRVFKAAEKSDRQALVSEMFGLTRALLGLRRKPWERIAENLFKMVMGRKWTPLKVFFTKPTEAHIMAKSDKGEQQRFVFVWVGERWYLLRIGRKQRPPPFKPPR